MLAVGRYTQRCLQGAAGIFHCARIPWKTRGLFSRGISIRVRSVDIHRVSDVISFHIYASWFSPPFCG